MNNAPPPPDEDRTTFRRLGMIALVLGFLAATDSAYELYQTDFSRPAAAFEFVLALSAIITGLGLLQRRTWVLQASVVTGVAGFLHSLIALIFLGSALLNVLTILGASHDPSFSAEYGLRLILIVAQVLFWPIVLGHLYISLQCRTEDPAAATEDKRTYWTCVGGTAAMTAMVELLLMAAPQGA